MGIAGDVFVGIDAGTTGVKVALFDARGAELGSGYSGYPCSYPHPGWAEQDVDDVWRGICRASRAARAAVEVADESIRSVGLSSQRGTFILLDACERPLAPAILWNDSRAGEMEPLLEERIGGGRYREITGMPVSGSWTAAKLAWLARHRPDLMRQVRCICSGQEYFLRCLGADGLESDPSSLTLHGMLDISRLDWSEEVCDTVGVGLGLLPPIGRPGTAVGQLSEPAAEATGLPRGVVLCRGGGDQQCAAIGAGIIRQGLAEVTIGTSAMMVAHLEHPSLVTGPAPYLGGHAIPGKWDAEGGAFSIGSCFKWWRDNFGQDAGTGTFPDGAGGYDQLSKAAAQAPAGSRGVVFHPFFAGQVTPYYDTMARGAFFGLGLDHDRGCLTRAVFEGCACEIRFMVDGLARDLDGGISELRMTGGGTRSALFMQILADVLRRPVMLPRHTECGVLGAAILGAVGAGLFPNVQCAVGEMVSIGRTVEPGDSVADLYQELFEIFRLAYDAGSRSGVYKAIYGFQCNYF